MDYSLKRAKTLGKNIREYYQRLGVYIAVVKVRIIFELQKYIFKIELLPGTKVQTIFTCAADVQAALKLHLFYPFKEGIFIFIAVSEYDVKENRLLKILKSPKFSKSEMEIPLALGYDLMGSMYIADLAKLLHLLIVGPSGTGKSVALQCIVTSIIVRCPVNSVRLIMFDIGANSLSIFGKVKHLYHPIVKDVEIGIAVLESLVAEMNERLSCSECECQSLPFLVCIIDEFDDTIASIENKEDAKRFVSCINSIIRRGRKAKVILILASHDPTLKNTKVNVNGIVPRIAFKCANHHNSLTALGVTGAENLPGEGAMLFKSQDECTPIPLQGSFVTSAEIEEILSNAPVDYDDICMLEIKNIKVTESIVFDNIVVEENKKELAAIVYWVLGHATISALQIQKKFKMGNRATKIMELLYKMNIVTDKFSNQPRTVIPKCIEELTSETVKLLEYHGYNKERLEKIFEAKNVDD